MLKRFPGSAVVGLLGWALIPIPSGADIGLGQPGSTGSAMSLVSCAARLGVATAVCCGADGRPGAAFGPLIDPRGPSVDLAAPIGGCHPPSAAFGPCIDPLAPRSDFAVGAGEPDLPGPHLGPFMDPSGWSTG